MAKKKSFPFESERLGGEWYKEAGREVFDRLAWILVKRGMTKPEAEEFLLDAYSAVANQYGD